MSKSSAPVAPSNIRLHRQSRILEIDYASGESFQLPCEYLRVYSPSAEVRGHSQGQEILQTGKRLVGLSSVEVAGNYALKLGFDDGHDSGIYSWNYLYRLCQEMEPLWQDYLTRMKAAGASRDPGGAVIIARQI